MQQFLDHNEFKESLRLWNNHNAIYHEYRIIDTCFRKDRLPIYYNNLFFSFIYTFNS